MMRLLNSSLWINLYKVYFIVAVPLVLILVFLTPPLQVPDESRHFLRVVQIASGHLLGMKNSQGHVGGDVPSSVQRIVDNKGYYILRDNFEVRLNAVEKFIAPLSTLVWDKKIVFVSFPGSAIYCFLAYLPSVFGVLIGKILGLTVLNTFYLSRLCNALCAVVLSTLAIKMITRGKSVVFALLLMPMTLFEFASVAQDAAIISCTALAIGLINKVVDNTLSKKMGLLLLTLIAYLLCVLAAAKPTYLPLVFVLPVMLLKSREFKISLLFSLLVCFIVVSWSWLVKGLVIPAGGGVDAYAQIHELLNHITKLPTLMFTTLLNDGFYNRSFVGKIGWMDYTALPIVLCTLFYFGMLLCCITDYFFGVVSKSNVQCFWIMVLCLMSVIAIYLVAYLLWTVVGSDLIFGVQGRYFIPIVMMLTLLFRSVSPKEMVAVSLPIMILLWISILLFVTVDVALIFEISRRYY